MNREHKYKDKDEYKDNDKDKDAERITESLTVCYIFGILTTQAFQVWWWIPPWSTSPPSSPPSPPSPPALASSLSPPSPHQPQHPRNPCQDPDLISRTFLEQLVLISFLQCVVVAEIYLMVWEFMPSLPIGVTFCHSSGKFQIMQYMSTFSPVFRHQHLINILKSSVLSQYLPRRSKRSKVISHCCFGPL